MIVPNVPYIADRKQEYASCQGPPSAMMALRFFKPECRLSFEELYSRMNYEKGKWFFETYIVKLFQEFSIPTVYYSTGESKKCNSEEEFEKLSGLNFQNTDHRAEFDIEHFNKGIDYAREHNLFKKVRRLDIQFIKERLLKSKLVIATINRNKLTKEPGYKGHFILIKGFTNETLICNDAYLGEDLQIKFDDFSESFYYPNWQKPKDTTEYVRDLVVIG